MAGAAGAAIIGVISVFMHPACEKAERSWGGSEKARFVVYITFIGTAGSLVDSLLGALSQQSVIDVRTKKIVEAPNSAKVMVEPGTHITTSAKICSGVGQAPQSVADAVPSYESSTIRNRQPLSTSPIVPERPNSRRATTTAQKWGVLGNNQVNLLMAAVVSLVAMVMWGGMGKLGNVVVEQAKTVVRIAVKQEIIDAVGVILAHTLG